MSFTLLKPFDVTIPAGTTKTNPLVTPTVFEDNVVDYIEWTFPDGCNGQVGIQVGARSVPVLPGGVGKFLVRSGNTSGVNLEGHHTTGDWSIIGYNLGSFSHIIHVVFHVHRIEPDEPPPPYLAADLVDMLHGGG